MSGGSVGRGCSTEMPQVRRAMKQMFFRLNEEARGGMPQAFFGASSRGGGNTFLSTAVPRWGLVSKLLVYLTRRCF